MVNDGASDTFARSDLRSIPQLNDSAPYAFLTSNRGRTFILFRNPVHGPVLRGLGLRAESLARCAFMFLFTPNAETRLNAQRFLLAVEDPRALRIGIHIRVGDSAFTNKDDFLVETYIHFFDCAAQIEQDRRKPWHTRVIWYLASDSLSLRRGAKKLYGEKLLTDAKSPAVHTECASHNASTCTRSVMKKAFQSVAADLHVLSKAQYHVVTSSGGPGQMGAWLSGEVSHPHTYVLEHEPPRKARPCSPEEAVPYERLSEIWSGK